MDNVEKRRMKMADVSLGHEAKYPRFFVMTLDPFVQTASLPNGKRIVFAKGRAEVKREDLEYFQDKRRFSIETWAEAPKAEDEGKAE
ncbi:MAG: hypothetical protein ACE15D_18745 [Candidatus Eisenbacteria bacterium]